LPGLRRDGSRGGFNRPGRKEDQEKKALMPRKKKTASPESIMSKDIRQLNSEPSEEIGRLKTNHLDGLQRITDRINRRP